MKRACDWAMPATVRGQRSGCGADYQSVGRPRAEAVLAHESRADGEPPITVVHSELTLEAAQALSETVI